MHVVSFARVLEYKIQSRIIRIVQVMQRIHYIHEVSHEPSNGTLRAKLPRILLALSTTEHWAFNQKMRITVGMKLINLPAFSNRQSITITNPYIGYPNYLKGVYMWSLESYSQRSVYSFSIAPLLCDWLVSMEMVIARLRCSLARAWSSAYV